MNYETVIGLEIHVELATKSKIYCSCATGFGAEVNTQICPICVGMPGTLPKLNKSVVEYAAKAGLALDCKVRYDGSKQDRKNYFYPDLPKAYQVSQYDLPLCYDGFLEINVCGDGEDSDNKCCKKKIGITRIHIEEDAGKLIHDACEDTLVDYNRCGVPLIEIVTEPDFRSSKEAKVFLEDLKLILQYIKVSDCKMQEGSLRCDINVSVRPEGDTKFGTRTEMKNVNSFSAVERAIEYESKRQIESLKDGIDIVQETRRWDDVKGKSYTLRSKEEAKDYRYFPEPDLRPITLEKDFLEKIGGMPQLPKARMNKYINEFNLSYYDAEQILSVPALSDFFEACTNYDTNPKSVANWLLSDISKILNEKNMSFEEIPFRHKSLADLINMINGGKISNTAGKKVLAEMFENDNDPEEIVERLGLGQVSDEGELLGAITEVLENNPKSVADYKAGKDKAIGFLVGQVMRATKGKGNPQVINSILLQELAKL